MSDLRSSLAVVNKVVSQPPKQSSVLSDTSVLQSVIDHTQSIKALKLDLEKVRAEHAAFEARIVQVEKGLEQIQSELVAMQKDSMKDLCKKIESVNCSLKGASDKSNSELAAMQKEAAKLAERLSAVEVLQNKLSSVFK